MGEMQMGWKDTWISAGEGNFPKIEVDSRE
jgi:hypothetical protein